MNLLLDRPVLLWWLNGHPTLSRKAKAAIADGKTLVLVGAVVIWEIRIMDGVIKSAVDCYSLK
jgi:PIN domain nuclease of toxin-antitoxin system